MKVRSGLSRLSACLLTTGLLAAVFTVPVSAARPGYDNQKLNIISEPGETSSKVSLYKGDKEASLNDLTWTDAGYHGKAVVLDGKNEYLKVGYEQMKVKEFTFTAWVKWKGSADGSENGLSGQKLFSIARNKDRWLSFSPYIKDTTKKNDSGQYCNGVYFGFSLGKKDKDVAELWNPSDGTTSYALPRNEWHHVAFTTSGTEMKVYLDGREWFTQPMVTSIAEIQALSLRIGSDIFDSPALNAVLDDVAIYETSLTAPQVQLTMQGSDPFDASAQPTTTSVYRPTQKTSTTVTTLTAVNGKPVKTRAPINWTANTPVFGLSVWAVVLLGTLLGVFILMSLILSIMELRRRKRRKKDDD